MLRITTILKFAQSFAKQLTPVHRLHEHYFKDLLNSQTVPQTLKIYSKIIKERSWDVPGLALTFRILSRQLKNTSEKEMRLVGRFWERQERVLGQLQMGELAKGNLKDFVVFFIQMRRKGPFTPPSMTEFASKIVNEFLKRWQTSHNNLELNVMCALGELIAYSFPQQSTRWLDFMMKAVEDYRNDLIADCFSLNELCQQLAAIYNPEVPKIVELVELVVGELNKLNIEDTMRIYFISHLLTFCQEWSWKSKGRTIQGLQKLRSTLERLVVANFFQYSQRVFQTFIPPIIKYNPSSPVLTILLEILARALNCQGQSCVHPSVFLESIHWLGSKQIQQILELNPNWEQSFLCFLQVYFSRGSKFKRLGYLHKITVEIAGREVLSDKTSQAVIQFANSQMVKPRKAFLD